MIIDAIRKTRLFQLVKVLSKRERFVFISAIVVLMVSGFTYGSLLLQTKTHPVAAEGGEFTEGVTGQPVFINPITPTTQVDRDIARIVFSSVGEIADSIKHSEDGETWNVRIKENIFWHDGGRLTADDIIFTLEVIQDPDSRSPLHASFQGVAAERVSELEVRFVLQNTYVFFENDHLENLRIIPKHIFNDIPIQNIKLSSFGLNPIGSGPYQVDSFEKNSDGIITSLRLVANKDYFEGRPNIKIFTFKFYKNVNDLVRSYNLGQIDGFGVSTSESLSENNVFIRNNTHYLESPRYYAVFINQSLAPEALKEIEIREALSATVDRERIVNDVFMSHAAQMYGPTPISENSISIEEFDPLLLEGLEINLTVPEEDFLVKTANILKENWESHGATVNVLIFSLKNIQENVLKNSDYEGESWEVTIPVNGIRALSPNGLTETYPDAALNEDFTVAGSDTGTLVWGRDADNPDAKAITLDDSVDTNGVLLAVYNLEADNQDMLVEDILMDVTITTGGTMNQVSDLVQTFDVEVFDEDGDSVIASSESGSTAANLTAESHTFNNLDFTIPEGELYTVEFSADFQPLDGTIVVDTDTIGIDIDASDTVAEQASGGDVGDSVAATGDITGEVHAVFTDAPVVTLVSLDIVKTLACDGACATGEAERAEGTIVFTVEAVGADVYLPDEFVEDADETDTTYGSGSTFFLDEHGGTEPTAAALSQSNADTSTNGWQVFKGQTKTFTYKVTMTATADGYQSVGMTSIEWGLTDEVGGHADNEDYTYSLQPDWETESMYLEWTA